MNTLKTAADLKTYGLVSEAQEISIDELSHMYSIGITSHVLDTIKEKDFRDPVFAQYVPSLEEKTSHMNESADPIGDYAHEVTKGLVHRYSDRVLFKITPTCSVYCRFCFRREMVGRGQDALSKSDLEAIYDYIANSPGIREVILSGGDPLVLSPRRLRETVTRLAEIPHIKTIRIHTRTPIAAPHLITSELLDCLKTVSNLVIVLHINHAQEINPEIIAVLHQLKSTGALLLSQSVLLKGVNNKAETLLDLFTSLRDIGVRPYYLHHPDKARGTAHFRVSITEGKELYQSLRGQISGHALPQYVLDIPGGFGKVPVNADWIAPHPDGGYTVRDIHGNRHRYYD